MGENVYKGIAGWHTADAKHPATHVLLSNEEYDALRQKINKAIQERDYIEKESRVYIEDAKRQAESAVSQAKKEAEKKIAEMTETLSFEIAERIYQENLTKNLLRINKERSNAERKLQPKKEHTGYVILQSQEKGYKFFYNRDSFVYKVWETSFQSPYTVDLSEEEARKEIKKDFFDSEGIKLLNSLGIEKVFGKDIEKLELIVGHPSYENKNVFCKNYFRRNFKSNYWEVIVTHTNPLKDVPENMKGR